MVWAAGERNIIFYAKDGNILGRYPEWVQEAPWETVDMLRRVGLVTNIEKTKSMV